MTKNELVNLIGEDEKASSVISEALDTELEHLKEEDVDSFIERHFDELKSLPITGAKIRGYKPGQAEDEKLASDFGYGSIDDLFKLDSKKHWTRYRKETLERLAKENGMTYDDFRSRLVNAQKAYDDVQLKKERQRIWEEGMNPKFKEHPFDWGRTKAMKMFMGNTLPDIEKAVVNGEDIDKLRLARDIALDAGFFVLNFAPGGRFLANASRLKNLGGFGRIAGGALYNGGLAAGNETAQAIDHDKEFDLETVLTAAALGGAFDIQGKQAADFLKSFGKGSKTARKVANDVEHSLTDAADAAGDYVSEMKSVRETFASPKDNPASPEYKMTEKNVNNTPVTEDMDSKAKEAMELFEHVKNGTRPQQKTGEHIEFLDDAGNTRRVEDFGNISDHDYYKMLSEHPELLSYQKSILAGSKKVRFGKKALDAVKTGKILHDVNAVTEADKTKMAKKARMQKEKDWENGRNLPRSASDEYWKEYQEWASAHPKQAESGRIAALFL